MAERSTLIQMTKDDFDDAVKELLNEHAVRMGKVIGEVVMQALHEVLRKASFQLKLKSDALDMIPEINEKLLDVEKKQKRMSDQCYRERVRIMNALEAHLDQMTVDQYHREIIVGAIQALNRETS